MNVYQENGFKDRIDYLQSLAEDYGIDYKTVAYISQLYGSEEDFDGLVSTLEEYYN